MILLGGLLLPLCYLVYDYSKFIPQKLTVRVSNDLPGIKNTLGNFPPAELDVYNIPDDIDAYQHIYRKLLEDEIRKYSDPGKFTRLDDYDVFTSTGFMELYVKKISVRQIYDLI